MSARVIMPDRVDLRRIIRDRLTLTDSERTMMINCALLSMHIWVGIYNEDIYCMWGVIPPTFLSNRAYVWLYTNDSKVVEHQFVFIRRSQIAVREMLKKFDVLYGTADKRNARTMRWLKWLGAEFEYAPCNMLDFVIRRK